MRKTHLLGGSAGIIVPWGIVTISTLNEWPERLHETLIGAAICITVSIGIGFIAVGNRHYYDRHLDGLRDEVDTAIKASLFGKALKQAGVPFRPAAPDKTICAVKVPSENAIAGMEESGVVDLDAVRDAIRHSHN